MKTYRIEYTHGGARITGMRPESWVTDYLSADEPTTWGPRPRGQVKLLTVVDEQTGESVRSRDWLNGIRPGWKERYEVHELTESASGVTVLVFRGRMTADAVDRYLEQLTDENESLMNRYLIVRHEQVTPDGIKDRWFGRDWYIGRKD